MLRTIVNTVVETAVAQFVDKKNAASSLIVAVIVAVVMAYAAGGTVETASVEVCREVCAEHDCDTAPPREPDRLDTIGD